MQRLLSELEQRLNGAIDFWTLCCLAPIQPDLHGFLDQQHHILLATTTVVGALLKQDAEKEPQRSLLSDLLDGFDRLRVHFAVLENLRHVPEEEIRQTTQDLQTLYPRLIATLRDLGQAFESSAPILEPEERHHSDHYDQVLSQLYDRCRDARLEVNRATVP